MPRFLTPARICLLALVQLYHAGKSSLEANLDLLAFIARHASNPSEYSLTIHSLKAPAFLDLNLNGFSVLLQQRPSHVPGRTMLDMFLQHIWELRGVDDFHDLMNRLSSIVYDPHSNDTSRIRSYSPSSPIGQFIRRCCVEFTRLQFAEMQDLWDQFSLFRSPSYKEWMSKKSDTDGDVQYDDLHDAFQAVRHSHLLPRSAYSTSISAIDANALLSLVVKTLQKQGARVPKALKYTIEKWIEEQGEGHPYSLQFFIAYFEHWRAGQYTMALDSLHRYFDHSLAARGGNDARAYYHYALLHLSVLHADFECWEESVDAMNECIATARENKDTDCLNFALSWLLHLRHVHPNRDRASYGTVYGIVGSNGSEHDEVAFLKAKARDCKDWNLMVSALLEEAKLELYSGGSIGRAQESIYKARLLSLEHDLRKSTLAISIFHAASYERIGQTYLAHQFLLSVGKVYYSECPANDRVVARCRLAHRDYQHGFTSKALQDLSALTLDAKGILKLEQKVSALIGLIEVKRSMRRDKLEAAHHLFSQLQPLRSISDPEMAFEIHIVEIELLLRCGSFQEALKLVSERLKELKEQRHDVAQILSLLLMKSKIFAAGGKPSKGFSLALRVISTAERLLIVPLFLDGLVVLGNILIELSSFAAARDILEAVIPHLLSVQDVHLLARAWVTLGEAHVGLAGECDEDRPVERLQIVRKAEDLIDRGQKAYHFAEDLDGQLQCMVMKSRLATWAGDDASVSQLDDLYADLLASRDSPDPKEEVGVTE